MPRRGAARRPPQARAAPGRRLGEAGGAGPRRRGAAPTRRACRGRSGAGSGRAGRATPPPPAKPPPPHGRAAELAPPPSPPTSFWRRRLAGRTERGGSNHGVVDCSVLTFCGARFPGRNGEIRDSRVRADKIPCLVRIGVVLHG